MMIALLSHGEKSRNLTLKGAPIIDIVSETHFTLTFLARTHTHT